MVPPLAALAKDPHIVAGKDDTSDVMGTWLKANRAPSMTDEISTKTGLIATSSNIQEEYPVAVALLNEASQTAQDSRRCRLS